MEGACWSAAVREADAGPVPVLVDRVLVDMVPRTGTDGSRQGGRQVKAEEAEAAWVAETCAKSRRCNKIRGSNIIPSTLSDLLTADEIISCSSACQGSVGIMGGGGGVGKDKPAP